MTLNLSGQQELRDEIAPSFQKMRQSMDLRKAIWDRLPTEKKRKWVISDKDPIMELFETTISYAVTNFPEMVDAMQE